MDKKTGFVLSNILMLVFSIFVTIKTKGKLPITKECFIGPLIILVLLILLYDYEPLIYDKEKAKKGEVWRILTYNLVHTTLIHLFFNFTGLILIWILFGNHFNVMNFLTVFLICSITCGLGVMRPSTHICHGLSGILMGLFIFGALKDIKDKQKIGYLLLFLIIIKIIREQIYGSNMTDVLDCDIGTDIHLCGIMGGITSFYLLK